jgi:hypothetical protein
MLVPIKGMYRGSLAYGWSIISCQFYAGSRDWENASGIGLTIEYYASRYFALVVILSVVDSAAPARNAARLTINEVLTYE